jgi:3'-phosphoadenosine 5'-phosphosulfate (PAPS) 3'-phosphatase
VSGLRSDSHTSLGTVESPASGRRTRPYGLPGRERAWIEGTAGDAPRAFADDPRGAVNGRPLRLLVSRSHTPDWIGEFGRALGDTTLVPCGSVGFKVATLVLGDADVYAHKQGLKEWDTCAPEVIARATGWAVSRADGTPHRYNEPNPRHDQFVACRPWLHARVIEALAAAT